MKYIELTILKLVLREILAHKHAQNELKIAYNFDPLVHKNDYVIRGYSNFGGFVLRPEAIKFNDFNRFGIF